MSKGEDGPVTYHLGLCFMQYDDGEVRLLAESEGWYEGTVTVAGKKRRLQLIDANGKFDFEWNSLRNGSGDTIYCLMVRDAERNLAAAQDIDEDAGPLDLRLAPALSLVGRVECDGSPVTNAGATLVFWTGNRLSRFGLISNAGPDEVARQYKDRSSSPCLL